MRILHTLPGRNWGGMEHRTLEQMRWLLDHGHETLLAAPGDGEPAERAIALGLPFVAAQFDHPYSASAILGLRALVHRFRPQVIDAHGGRDGKTAGTCLGLSAVVRDRHITQRLRGSFSRGLQWRWGCDHVIAVAELVRDMLLEARLAVPERISVVGEWAEDRFFAPPPEAAQRLALRASLGLAEGTFAVAAVAMLRPDKGQAFLIRAIALLRDSGIDATCLLVGAPTPEGVAYTEDLHRLTTELGLENKVVFVGYREDIPDVLAAADALAIPSLANEAQSRVVPQAFACSRPVVASTAGGLPELVRPQETGWLVPPGNAGELARALTEMASDRPKVDRIVNNARRFAETSLRLDAKMEETLAVYATAITRAQRRRAKFS